MNDVWVQDGATVGGAAPSDMGWVFGSCKEEAASSPYAREDGDPPFSLSLNALPQFQIRVSVLRGNVCLSCFSDLSEGSNEN